MSFYPSLSGTAITPRAKRGKGWVRPSISSLDYPSLHAELAPSIKMKDPKKAGLFVNDSKLRSHALDLELLSRRSFSRCFPVVSQAVGNRPPSDKHGMPRFRRSGFAQTTTRRSVSRRFLTLVKG
jgi:hypothetical protein